MNFIFRPQLLINTLKIIIRKCKFKKLLLFLFIIFILCIYLISDKLFSFYLLIKCFNLKYQSLNIICKSYLDGKFQGLACSKFCSERSIYLSDCPNQQYHNGKDYVFGAKDKLDNEFILKSREIHVPANLTVKFRNNDQDRNLLIKTIEQIIKETFKNDLDINLIENIIPSNQPVNLSNLDQLNFTMLLNIYQLLQDNEYLLTMTLNNIKKFSSLILLPKQNATCGNWYLEEKFKSIIDHTYLDVTHSTNVKLLISKKLMDFLFDFESMQINFELCDLKYEHFAADDLKSPNSSLVLIDSDMIYHHENVKSNVEAIKNCERDEDCEFVDCKGICSELDDGSRQCNLDLQDNNLKRICRNLFFIEPFNLSQLYDKDSLGLLVNLDKSVETDVKLIYDLCFQDNLINLTTKKVYALNEKIELIRLKLDSLIVF